MALSPPSGIVVEYDNSGGSLVDISQHVLTLGDFKVEQITEEKHSFGDLWEEHLPVGVGRLPALPIGGLYDDTAATGPNALFGGQIPISPATASRTLKITWLADKTSSVETTLLDFTRSADRSALTKYTATVQPTGAVTEV